MEIDPDGIKHFIVELASVIIVIVIICSVVESFVWSVVRRRISVHSGVQACGFNTITGKGRS
jgi:hypothetical protein